MNGAVDPSVHVVGRDEACEETDASGPSGLIGELGPDELAALFGGSSCQACHNDYEESCQAQCDWGGQSRVEGNSDIRLTRNIVEPQCLLQGEDVVHTDQNIDNLVE